MSLCNLIMVQAANCAGINIKKPGDVRRKLKTSLKGPLRTGRSSIPRPKYCFHCTEKFHSDFCRRLKLKNIKERKLLPSKYECLTCRKRFKGIANFLLHRTLHNEINQDEGNADVTRRTFDAENSSNQERTEETDETNYRRDWILKESIQEFDLENESKQGDDEKCLPIHRDHNKAGQPTGARKRKGKLRMQYISPNDIHGAMSEDDEKPDVKSMQQNRHKVSEDDENPTVFIIPGDSELGLTPNGRLDDSDESMGHRFMYWERANEIEREEKMRNDEAAREALDNLNACSCANCRSGHMQKRSQCHSHGGHQDHLHFHDECCSDKCNGHKKHHKPCRSGGCCDDAHNNLGGQSDCHAYHQHCHDQHCIGSKCHGVHCHGGCHSKHEWRDFFYDDEERRMRPKQAALFKELCNSMACSDQHDHSRLHPFDSYPPHLLRNNMFPSPDPMILNYGVGKSGAYQRPNSKDPFAHNKAKNVKNSKSIPSRDATRKLSESDLYPLDATTLTNDVMGFHQSGSRRAGATPPNARQGNDRRDIFTAPGSAIRRMKELVSKYSNRNSNESTNSLNKPVPAEFLEKDESDMLNAGDIDSTIDPKSEAYVCHICGKEFAWAVTLKRHMLIHTGVRQYQCNICNKAFTRSHHLKRHMTVHTGEKPYVCHICNKAYSRSDRLSTHMSNHEGYVSNKKKGKQLAGKPAEIIINAASVVKQPPVTTIAPNDKEAAGLSNSYVALNQPLKVNGAASHGKVYDDEKKDTEKIESIDAELENKSESVAESNKAGNHVFQTPDDRIFSPRSDVPPYPNQKTPSSYSTIDTFPEQDYFHGRYHPRPASIRQPEIFPPSNFPVAMRSGVFASDSVLDRAVTDRHDEMDKLSVHDARSPHRSPSAASNLPRAGNGLQPDISEGRRADLTKLMDTRDEFLHKQHQANIPMYFHNMPFLAHSEMQHNILRDGMKMEHLMQSPKHGDKVSLFGSGISSAFGSMNREDNKVSDFKEETTPNHPNGSKFDGQSSSIQPAAPSPKTDTQEQPLHLFTFRHMVNRGRRDHSTGQKRVLPRTFVCQTCNKGFTRSHHLRRHELIHSGQKPYKCTICGRAFNRSDHLNLHLATHYQSSNSSSQFARERGKAKKNNPPVNQITEGESEIENADHCAEEQLFPDESVPQQLYEANVKLEACDVNRNHNNQESQMEDTDSEFQNSAQTESAMNDSSVSDTALKNDYNI